MTLTKEITAGLGATPAWAVTFFYASAAPLCLVLEVTGFISGTGDALTPLTPARSADTRTGSGLPNAGQTLTAGGTVTIQATGRGGIPVGARSVVVNVAVPSSTTSGTLTIYPGGTRPATTSLTRTSGAIAFNQVTTNFPRPGPSRSGTASPCGQPHRQVA